MKTPFFNQNYLKACANYDKQIFARLSIRTTADSKAAFCFFLLFICLVLASPRMVLASAGGSVSGVTVSTDADPVTEAAGYDVSFGASATPGSATPNEECQITGGPTYSWTASPGKCKPTDTAETTVTTNFSDPGTHTVTVSCTVSYTVTNTDDGTTATISQTGSKTVTVNALPKNWTPGDPIQGGDIVGPAEVTVGAGEPVPYSVSFAYDIDHWSSAGIDGDDYDDDVHFLWTSSDGSLSDDSSNGVWTAPTTPGDYTLTCKIDDTPAAVTAPDTGSRDDPSFTRTITVHVVSKVWTPGDGIQGGALSGPSEISVLRGDIVRYRVKAATDQDHWVQGDESGDEPDGVTYHWTGPGLNSTGRSGTWVAPDQTGDYTLTCIIDDLPTAVTAPDTGSRDDPSITCTLTVHVLPKVWDKGNDIQGGNLTVPSVQIIGPGYQVLYGVATATDNDHWTAGGQSGTAEDNITYHWTGPADANGQPLDSYSQSGYWEAPDVAGTYTFNCTIDDDAVIPLGDTGSRKDGPLSRSFSAKVVIKNWDPGQPIEGGDIVGPPEITVQVGDPVPYNATHAYDIDHWTAGTDSGDDYGDEVHFHWSSSDGSLDDDSENGSWMPPGAGTYTLTCVADDTPVIPTPPDTGSRDDAPKTTSQIVHVVQKVWSPGSPIGQPDPADASKHDGRMLKPQDQTKDPAQPAIVAAIPGQTLRCKLEAATDLDHWTAGDQSGDEPDEVNYVWSCSAGGFNTGKNPDGTPKIENTATGIEAKWVAPITGPSNGPITITCTVNDKPLPVNYPNTGSRDDADALVRTCTVVLASVSISAEKEAILAGGGDSNLAKTKVTAVVTAGGNPLAGVSLYFSSIYVNDQGDPILDPQGNTAAAGSFDNSSATTEGDGKAITTLTSGKQLGTAAVRVSFDDPEPVGPSANVKFEPPAASIEFGDWDPVDDGNDDNAQDCPVTVNVWYQQDVVPSRKIQLVITKVYSLDANRAEVDVPDPGSFASFEEASGTTDDQGQYQTTLHWKLPDTADPSLQYYIVADVIDPSISPER